MRKNNQVEILLWEHGNCYNVLLLWQEKKEKKKTKTNKLVNLLSFQNIFAYLKMDQYYYQNEGVTVYSFLLNSHFQVISKLL